jgi:hypothetical protein
LQRGLSVLLFSRAGFSFSPIIISSLQAANFGLGCSNPRIRTHRKAKAVTLLLANLFLSILTAHAQNGWGPPRGSSDWNTPSNWVPAAPPGGPTGTALFGNAATRSLTFSGEPNGVGTLRFLVPGYSFQMPSFTLTITGSGIEATPANAPTFDLPGGRLVLSNSSTAGNATINAGIAGSTNPLDGGFVLFHQNSSAGNAAITANFGSNIEFNDSSTADNATIITNNGGKTSFFSRSTGGNAEFITNSSGGRRKLGAAAIR